MLLIADAGSTKTAWALTDPATSATTLCTTSGINPAVMPPEAIRAVIAGELLPQLGDAPIAGIHFYGAGVVSPECVDIVRHALAPIGAATVSIGSDMLGAARALLGRGAGIACILGTGSNTCLYDGSRITDNVPPMGYILGDEGSGASIGRRFVGDLFKRMLPPDVEEAWRREISLTAADVIERVYRQPGANVFLASLVPFILSQTGHTAVRALIDDEFDRFFLRNVERYDTVTRRLGFVGSVALHLRGPLLAAARRHGYEVTAIIGAPLENLIKFHAEKN